MSSELFTGRKKTRSEGQGISILYFVISYALVVSSTFYIHTVSTKPLREQSELVSSFFDVDKRTPKGERPSKTTIVNDVSSSLDEDEFVDAATITSILKKETELPTGAGRRLKFRPGGLNMTREETLRHCYVDPKIYESHFPSNGRQVTSVSEEYKLIYLMIPKSGSSTGRWIMGNVLGAEDAPMSPYGVELNRGGDYADHTVITFVRDPLSRFYSSYDEVFLRYGPWFRHRKGKAFQYLKTFSHPYPYLYENMTTWEDFQDAFCPSSLVKRKECLLGKTHDNGTLAARFERFVWDYDGLSPFDLVRIESTRM